VAKASGETRHERLAAALRANLRRRKTHDRAEPRETADGTDMPSNSPDETGAERTTLSPQRDPN
jgi:hypothetical protein